MRSSELDSFNIADALKKIQEAEGRPASLETKEAYNARLIPLDFSISRDQLNNLRVVWLFKDGTFGGGKVNLSKCVMKCDWPDRCLCFKENVSKIWVFKE